VAVTVSVTLDVGELPAAFEQVRLKTYVPRSIGVMVKVALGAWTPLQPLWLAFAFPDAVQLLAPTELHVSVVVVCAWMLVAPRVRVGAGGVTTADVATRDTDTGAEGPPRFEQTSVNVSAPTTAGVIVWLPVAASVPLQLPEAVQLVAVAELQLRVVDLPTATEVDASVSVGATGGVPEVANRVAESAADEPPAPVHVSV
jgi:hypothetical protein